MRRRRVQPTPGPGAGLEGRRRGLSRARRQSSAMRVEVESREGSREGRRLPAEGVVVDRHRGRRRGRSLSPSSGAWTATAKSTGIERLGQRTLTERQPPCRGDLVDLAPVDVAGRRRRFLSAGVSVTVSGRCRSGQRHRGRCEQIASARGDRPGVAGRRARMRHVVTDRDRLGRRRCWMASVRSLTASRSDRRSRSKERTTAAVYSDELRKWWKNDPVVTPACSATAAVTPARIRSRSGLVELDPGPDQIVAGARRSRHGRSVPDARVAP